MRRIGFWGAGILIALGIVAWGGSVYFDRAVRTGLDQAIQRLPPGYTVTYKTASYSPLTGKAEVGGIEIHVSLTSGRFDGSIDQLELVRPNLKLSDGWNDAVANPVAWRLDQALPVADQILLRGLHVQSAFQTVDVDTERLDGGRLYPAALLHPGLPGPGLLLGGFQAGQKPSDEMIFAMLRLEAAFALGFGCDRWENIGFRASGKTLPTSALPEQSFTYEIAQLTASGLDRGVWQSLTGEDIAFSSTALGTVKLGRLAFTGLDMRAVAIRLLDAAALAPTLFDGLSLKRLDYADMTVQSNAGIPLSLEDFTLADVVVAQGEPVSGALRLQGLRLSQNQMTDPAQIAMFTQLGIDHVTVSLGVAFDRDVATGRATVHDTYLKLDELGSVDLSADLVEMPIGANPLGAKLAWATLHYRDASLVDRLLRLMARGGDPEQARGELTLIARQQGEAFGPDLTAALVAFVQKPIALTAELAPPEPLPLAALAVLRSWPRDQLAKVLGLTLQANQ
jgi:hypothetical protein